MNPNRRETVKGQIRALRAKTLENGCTREEVEAATRKVAQLIDQYNFEESELRHREAVAEPVGRAGQVFSREEYNKIEECWHAAAIYCDCKSWFDEPWDGRVRVVLFGHETDVELCRFMLDMFRNVNEYEWYEYRKMVTPDKIEENSRVSFNYTFGKRLADRLFQMKEDRNNYRDTATKRTGNELVVVKNAIVEQKFQMLGIKLRKSKIKERVPLDAVAAVAGRIAADNVHITTAIKK